MELEKHRRDPFSKLATEVMGHIFEHCLPPESEPISLKSVPILLLRVCRRWEEITLGTPRLWQNIQLEEIPAENLTCVLNFFLSQSGILPLRITHPVDDLGWYFDAKKNFITQLLDNFHRVLYWKGRARSLFSYFEFIPSAPDTAPAHIHAPLLKRLNLSGNSQTNEELARKYRHNRIIAPNLQELHLDSSGVGLSIVSFSPESLRVLTDLFIIPETRNCDLSFLCKTINLTTLEIKAFDQRENINIFPSSVYLPNLKRLQLLIAGAHLTKTIVSSLCCPAIEELTLDLTSTPDDLMPLPNVIDCLTKGQTPLLRSLSTSILGKVSLSSHHRLKDVEELTLLSGVLGAAIQILMEKGEREFHLFPRLSSFTIQRSAMLPRETDAVLRLLKARCTLASGGTLTRARFQKCKFRKSDVARIRALEKELEGNLTVDIIDSPSG